MIIDTTDSFAIKQKKFALKMLDTLPWPKRTKQEKEHFISCLPECLLKEVAEAILDGRPWFVAKESDAMTEKGERDAI